MSDEPKIEYTVKEVVDRIDRKIDQFIGILNQKVDRAEFLLLLERVDDVEATQKAMASRIKHDERKAKDRREWRRWVIPTVITLVGSVATIASIVLH